MSQDDRIHRVQVHILYQLRHRRTARFSELMRDTDLTSDSFKYHIQRLLNEKYLVKTDDGLYELTPVGKEFANRLNEVTGLELSYPKPSMLLVVVSSRDDTPYYLIHKRTREPFFGFWGIPSGPVPSGIAMIDAASEELKKQTGIAATFEQRGMLRVTDKSEDDTLLEDKLFMLMYTEVEGCPSAHDWHGGASLWMNEQELLDMSPLFPTTKLTLKMINGHLPFAETVATYLDDEY